MARTYADIQAEISSLQAEADELKRREVSGVVARIREAIAHYGITAEDLGFGLVMRRGPGRPPTKSQAKAVAVSGVKFADGKGNVWGGRGPRPAWLREALAAGRQLEDFSVLRNTPSAPSKRLGSRSASRPRKV